MNRIPRFLSTFTFLVLFAGSTFVAALPQVRPPLPPGLKGKDLEKLRRQNNNNNDRRRQEYEKKKREENDRYHVAQIGLTFEVVQKKNFGSLKKSAPNKYKAQLSEYNKARDAAVKNLDALAGKAKAAAEAVQNSPFDTNLVSAKAEADKAYQAAQQKNKKIKGLKPPRTVFRVLTKKGFKSQTNAKSYADKLNKQVDSKRKK